MSSRQRKLALIAAIVTVSLLGATPSPIVATEHFQSDVMSMAPSQTREFGELRVELNGLKGRATGLSSELRRLAGTTSGISGLPLSPQGDVQVYVETTGDPSPVADQLRAGGHAVENVDTGLRLIQARISSPSLRVVAALPGVRFVRRPDYGSTSAGSVLTEGDALLNAPNVRSSFGVDGTGVRVGVISDGLEGLGAAQSQRDLPAVNHTACDVIESAPAGQPADPVSPGAGNEGTAMLQVIHDMAPGAELWFGYFGRRGSGTSLDFMDAVDCLAANVDVIVDDVYFLNAGPYDGSSTVSVNTAATLNSGSSRLRGYYTAVGNLARHHYEEPFLASGYFIEGGSIDWTMHRFGATAGTTDAGSGYLCDDAPAQGYCGDLVALMPGASISVALQWNDPWGASANDYDLFLIDETPSPDVVHLLGADTQDGNDNPVENVTWQNTTGADQFVDIVIGGYGAPAPRTFDMFVSCSGCYVLSPEGEVHNFNTVASSVPNNSDAVNGVVSLGAIYHGEPDAIEASSGRGPTNGGATKPDVAAFDGVSVLGTSGAASPFYGTSAAAAHAGGVAALVISCRASLLHGEAGDNPPLDRTLLQASMLGSGVDLGAPGLDNTFGYGRIDAEVAAGMAGCSDDADGDGILNAADNCPTVPNPPQTNTDSTPIVTAGAVADVTVANADRFGDLCDPDDDNDGRLDAAEASGCNGSGATNQVLFDTDGDGAGDGAECVLGTNPTNAASRPPMSLSMGLDPDQDGLGATMETLLGTSPLNADTDGDGIGDGIEFRGYNTSPTKADTDADACGDGVEVPSLNDDLNVNSLDLTLISQRFGSATARNMDVNRDGSVNANDVAYVAARFESGTC